MLNAKEGRLFFDFSGLARKKGNGASAKFANINGILSFYCCKNSDNENHSFPTKQLLLEVGPLKIGGLYIPSPPPNTSLKN